MKEALELFYEKAYLKSEKQFLACKSEDKLQASKYLFLISLKLKNQKLSNRFNEYLAVLAELGHRSDFVQLLRKYPDLEVQSSNWNSTLIFFWQEGDLENFNKWSEHIWSLVIEKKLYNFGGKIFAIIKERRPHDLYNYLRYLNCLTETNNQIELCSLVAELRGLINTSKIRERERRVDRLYCFEKVSNVIEVDSESSLSLVKEHFKLERDIAILKKQKLSKDFVLEYVILFKDELKELVLLLEGEVLDHKQKLIDVIKASPIYKTQKELLPAHIKALLSTRVPKQKTVVEEVGDDGLYTSEEYEVKPGPLKLKQHFSGKEEKRFMQKIRAKDEDILSNCLEVANSLVSVGFYEAAFELLKLKEPTKDDTYLRCFVLEELGKYYELRDFIEESLKTRTHVDEDLIPYQYLLGKANLALGNKNKALVAFKCVFSADPSFRNVQEMIARAKT